MRPGSRLAEVNLPKFLSSPFRRREKCGNCFAAMAEQRIIFNSSMPRSGSTLLQNILAQNPRFYCSPTSPLLELLVNARSHLTTLAEFMAQDQRLMRDAFLGFCHGALRGY